ncbi:MAG TPA: hypothetical protein DIC34_08925 [Treponema sp.]|nr:MAG: hypothetical protein A2Y36_01890 [Treponema sp. GWA1_62_8]OHE76131.1 MAG: hypothetical protein A2413_13990 [Treponema sp. RIFOXYC1_FULL_61_9]HCM26650.1 hypothetical protein [Treponema sp.]
MRPERSDEMYRANKLLDEIRTEFYELLDFEIDAIGSSTKETRRREVLYLIAELRVIAENS